VPAANAEDVNRAGAGAEGCYGSSMGDDWRVRIALVDLPRELADDGQVYARGYPASPQEIAAAAAVHAEMESYRQALIPELGSRLGDQVAVGSSGTDIFLYASSAGSADEAARVAREVLARHDVSAPVRVERWGSRDEEWLDVTDQPSADVAAEQQAEHEYVQEQERETSVTTGRPAWAMTVELRSRRDAVALAGHLAAQGWQVRRLRKDLIVWADCEDDAKGLDQALSGDAYMVFRVRRVSYGRNIPLGPPPQGPLIFGPLGAPSRLSRPANSQVTAPHHRSIPNRVLSQVARQVVGGPVGVNAHTIDMAGPFGGMKDSGSGRECGVEGIADYTQLKTLMPPVGTYV
jgi:hypothetical protein